MDTEQTPPDPDGTAGARSGRRLVTVKQFATELGVSERTVRDLVQRGLVQHRKFGNITKFVLPDDLDEYLDAARVPRREDSS